jgi:hypothetical protein
LWELCVLGSFVDVNISCRQFWCDVIWDPFPHMIGCSCRGFCMVNMEYIFNIFSRNVVSFVQEITQINFDVMFWCIYSYRSFVYCIISVVHVVCESIWIGVRLKFILLLFIENTHRDVSPKKHPHNVVKQLWVLWRSKKLNPNLWV